MRSLCAAELLDIWEQGQACSKVQRALLLLIQAYPEHSLDTLLQLTIGQRDAYLLDLRESIFGSQIAGLVECPGCGDRIEIELQVSDLHLLPPDWMPHPLALEQEGYSVQFRLPTSADLTQLPLQNPTQAKQQLLEQCFLSAQYQGQAQPIETLPTTVIEAVIREMAQADRQADLQFALDCPECQHHWQIGFDIVSFLWREIDGWARRTLEEVHQLASAYGWREADILAMSPWRRHYYLELCQL
jgi:hypothetical protein